MNIKQKYRSAPGARIYRRSVLRLVGLGLMPPMAFTALLSCREQRAGHDSLPTVQEPLLNLPSIRNFRDVSGAGEHAPYRNVHGVALRRRVLYRSGWISADDADLRRLRTLGIQVIYDMRSQDMRKRNPDHVPQGTGYVPMFSLRAGLQPSDPQVGAAATAQTEDFMRLLVTDETMRAHTRALLMQLSIIEGAQIFHCTEGNELTGWITALLHTVAELPAEIIMSDYLLSNASHDDDEDGPEALTAQAAPDAPAAASAEPAVQARHLLAAIHEATARHGSVAGFLKDGLLLDAAAQQRLRRKLLDA